MYHSVLAYCPSYHIIMGQLCCLFQACSLNSKNAQVSFILSLVLLEDCLLYDGL